MKTVNCQCSYCEKTFQKSVHEWKRSEARASQHFCGLSCTAKWRNKNCPNTGNPQNLVSGNRRDEFTPFKYFIRRAMYRKKNNKYRSVEKREVDITAEYLQEIWKKQNGICPIAGVNLILPQHCDAFPFDSPVWKRASLDRIDSSKGYIKGNVRFICWMANVAKGTYSDDMLIDFCHTVSKNNPA